MKQKIYIKVFYLMIVSITLYNVFFYRVYFHAIDSKPIKNLPIIFCTPCEKSMFTLENNGFCHSEIFFILPFQSHFSFKYNSENTQKELSISVYPFTNVIFYLQNEGKEKGSEIFYDYLFIGIGPQLL